MASAVAPRGGTFEFPDFYHFPPFFTLQPVLETRRKQIRLWCDLIVAYHQSHQNHTLDLNSSTLFHNTQLHRKLSEKFVDLIAAELVDSGFAEWEDSSGARLRLMWKKPEEWAAKIYDYVKQRAMLGTMYTVYELHAGDDTKDADFYGMESWLLRKALAILEDEGKAIIHKGASAEEDGVKFIAVD